VTYFYPQDSPCPWDSECQNCNRVEHLVWLYEWGFWACPQCAEESDLTAKAEATCPDLLEQVCACESVKEIQEVMRRHACEKCTPVFRRAA
jgi:hypothetical protein